MRGDVLNRTCNLDYISKVASFYCLMRVKTYLMHDATKYTKNAGICFKK